ncbi:MAG TPA: peptide deformylase [Clostridiales bacterium]|jgi:peptide deformylase|nr:peptide deformylase [Clostridiales bacterium]
MAILNIVKIGDPVLRKTSRPIDKITDRIRLLAADMIETMHEADGAGLAAPQVGVLRRMVVIETEDEITYVMINPEIIERCGRQRNVEGCLSVPGEWGVTDRPETVTVKYTDLDGKEQTLSGSELLARAICHELDHLDGKLFIDGALMLDENEISQLRRGEFDAQAKVDATEGDKYEQ